MYSDLIHSCSACAEELGRFLNYLQDKNINKRKCEEYDDYQDFMQAKEDKALGKDCYTKEEAKLVNSISLAAAKDIVNNTDDELL